MAVGLVVALVAITVVLAVGSCASPRYRGISLLVVDVAMVD